MTAPSRRSSPSRSRPPRTQPTPPAPRRELVHRGDNAYANSMADAVNQFADPFLNAPPPEQGTAGVVANYLNGAMGLVGAPAQLIDTAIAQGLGALSNVPVLGALIKAWPSMPAATILSATHLAPPHAHLHPPSFIPPATPIPLPSFGPVMLSGCVSVLIEGVPAARCGDVGLAITCGSLAPPFEIMTGSSTVFIGGARAARLTDLTRHCNPMGALGAFAKVMAVAGAAAGLANAMAMSNESDALAARGRDAAAESLEADSEAEAASAAGEAQNLAAESAGKSLAATMAAAQAAADAGALAMSVLCGKDLGVGITMGALVGAPGTVSIGGIPMPNLGQMIMGKAFEKLKALGKKLRRRGAAPDANGTHCNAGHPVDIITGAVFDRYLDAVTAGGFRWERHYTSARMREMGPLGWGMRHSLEHELHVRLHRCAYVDGRGRRVEFPRFRPGESRVSRFGYVLERLPDHRYRVTYRDEPALVFRARPFETDATLESVCAKEYSLALAYDAAGHLTGFTEHRDGAPPRMHRVAYDDAWRIVAVEGSAADGRAWRCGYAYDRDGCLAVARDAHGHDEHYAYDALHRLTSWTDRRGYTYRWRYDADDRCVWTSGEDGQWYTELEYAPSKSETRVTTGPGAVWAYQYDPADGVLLRIEDPYGGEYLRERDETDGRVVREVDWAGGVWALHYDADGAHVGRTDPFGRALPTQEELPEPPLAAARTLPESPRACVFPLRPPARSVDVDVLWRMRLPPSLAPHAAQVLGLEPEAAAPWARYDALGNPEMHADALGRVRRWSHDATNNEVCFVDREGRRWQQEIARWNLVGAEVDPLGHRTRYEYTDAERICAVTDPNGHRSEYEYDAKDRLVAVRRLGALHDRYVWDRRDALVARHDGRGEAALTIEPHANGLPAKITLARGGELRLDYDARGEVTEASTERHRVERAFDAQGRRTLDRCDDRGVEHRWGPHGIARTVVWGRYHIEHSVTTLGSLRVLGPSGFDERLRVGDDGALLRTSFCGAREALRYDREGRLLGCLGWRRARPGAWGARFAYNAEGELVSAARLDGAFTEVHLDGAGRLAALRAPDGELREFPLDAAGNVLRRPGVGAMVFGAGNLIERADREVFAHDARHRVSARDDGRLRWRYEYDSLDRLVAARCDALDGSSSWAWSAEYDAIGRRVARTLDGRRWEYTWDGDRLAAEVRFDGEVRVFVYATSEALSPVGFVRYPDASTPEHQGRAYAIFYDPLGMPERIEDADGAVVWWADTSDPYGLVDVAPDAAIDYEARWPGHWHDAETGLHYNRHRYYDPRLCRYVQSDPSGVAGGVNLYAYAEGNPLTGVDVLGLAHPGRMRRAVEHLRESVERVTTNLRRFGERQVEAVRNAMRRARGDFGGNITPLLERNIGRGLTPDQAAEHMWSAIHGVVEPEARAQRAHAERLERMAENRRNLEAAEQRVNRLNEPLQEDFATRNNKDNSREDRAAAARRIQEAQNSDEHRAAVAERNRLRQEASELGRSAHGGAQEPGRVVEAAYDPSTGRMVVVRSGNELPQHINPAPVSVDTTTPGKCGMPRSADVIEQGRPPEQRGGPIHTVEGGLSYDHQGNLQHVSACNNCRVIGGLNPQIGWGGGMPPGVPPGTGANVRTPIEPRQGGGSNGSTP